MIAHIFGKPTKLFFNFKKRLETWQKFLCQAKFNMRSYGRCCPRHSLHSLYYKVYTSLFKKNLRVIKFKFDHFMTSFVLENDSLETNYTTSRNRCTSTKLCYADVGIVVDCR
jgi:hypothetical protein